MQQHKAKQHAIWLATGGFTTPHVAGYTTERATECTPQLGTCRALNHGWRMEIRGIEAIERESKGGPGCSKHRTCSSMV